MIGSPSWINVGTTPFGLSLRYAVSILVPAQRHDVVLGLLPLFRQRDANLLSADRIDAVIEFQQVILPQLCDRAVVPDRPEFPAAEHFEPRPFVSFDT